MVAVPENCGSRSGPSIAADELGPARAAHIAEEALQDAEVGVARGLDARCVRRSSPMLPETRSRVSSPTRLQLLDLHLAAGRARSGSDASFLTA